MPSRGRGGKGSGHHGIADDEARVERVVLATFLNRGKPSFMAAREVGRETGESVSAVITLLHAAYERGMFHIHVDLPQERKDVSRLESALGARYGLRKVLLVAGRPEIMGEMDEPRRRALHTGVIREMAAKVVPYVDEVLGAAARNGEAPLLGVAWGRSLSLIARYLETSERRVCCPGLRVVPIVGVTATLNRDPVEANIIAMNVAQSYGGLSEQLPAPAFVPRVDYSVVTARSPIRSMLQRLRGCDVVLTSMGPIPESSDDSEITLSNDPELNAALLQSARRDGAIGEICYSLFAGDGREVQSDYRAIGLGFEGLQRIAADKRRQVILVAGGDRRRFEPLRAALRARLASVLVSDTVTARYLLDEVQP